MLCMRTEIAQSRAVPVALRVREANADLWAPDAELLPSPAMLVGEPAIADAFQSPDGRSWVRVYYDGSALDQGGIVHARSPRAACERRLPVAA